jgi:hypothetical protein
VGCGGVACWAGRTQSSQIQLNYTKDGNRNGTRLNKQKFVFTHYQEASQTLHKKTIAIFRLPKKMIEFDAQ